jgi:hypothetical protein
MTPIEKMRAVLERLVTLRAAGVDDYANLSALFEALKKIGPDSLTRRVAGVGRFLAEDMSGEFEGELDSLIGLLDALVKESEDRNG